MDIGAKDALGRVLKIIRNRRVLVRSEQVHGVAICDSNKADGTPCGWTLEAKNVMGVAAQHAATKCHKVSVRRELATEYDGETPNKRD